MKVSELITFLQKCAPDGDVTAAFASDNPMDGNDVSNIIEIVHLKDGFANTVVLIM